METKVKYLHFYNCYAEVMHFQLFEQTEGSSNTTQEEYFMDLDISSEDEW